MDRKIHRNLLKELKEIPAFDVHCHLKLEKPQAQNIGDILFYHFLRREVCSAGGDDNFFISKDASLDEKVDYFLKYLPLIENTTSWWCVKKIFRDLYGLEEPLNQKNWMKIEEKIEKTKNDDSWPEKVLKGNLKIEKSLCCYNRFGSLEEEKRKERSYLSIHPEGLIFGPLLGKGFIDGLPTEKKCANLKDASASVHTITHQMLKSGLKSYGIVFDYLFQPVFLSEEKLDQIYLGYLRGESLTDEELNALSTHFLYQFLETIKGKVTIQAILGVIWGFGAVKWQTRSGESFVMISNNLIPALVQVLKDFPQVNFNLFYCTKSLSQPLTIIARMLPNVSLLGFEWHNLFPTYIEELISERIDALPSNKWILVATDAYNCEWSYGKFSLVLECMAKVLTQKIEDGYLDFDRAIFLARKVLYENPKKIYKL